MSTVKEFIGAGRVNVFAFRVIPSTILTLTPEFRFGLGVDLDCDSLRLVRLCSERNQIKMMCPGAV